MSFPQPLARGRLVQRYKRFLADVALESGEAVAAHMPNPGRLLGLAEPGAVCWLSRSTAPGRKLPWTVELMEAADGALVGVNPNHANTLAADAVTSGALAELSGYAALRREAPYGARRRIDLLLEGPATAADAPRCWVEVKSVTLSRAPGLAEWPDCVSSRSSGQLAEMSALAAAGDRAVLLFVAQRSDCGAFRVAADLDPAFARALHSAQAAGVEVLAYDTTISPAQLELRRRIG